MHKPNLRRLLFATTIATVAACAAAPLGAHAWPFGSDRVEGDGNIVRQARQVSHFSGIALGVPGKLELRMGNDEGVTIETDGNLQPLIETVVEDGVLRIRPASDRRNLRTDRLHIVVHAREIDRLSLGGSGSIAADTLRARRLNVDIGGSGRIDLRSLESEELAVKVGGSGDLRAGGGSARTVKVSVAGSGNVDLGQVAAHDANVRVAGSGDVTVWAKESLGLKIAGSGDVGYYGDPAITRSVAGSGKARRLGGAPR